MKKSFFRLFLLMNIGFIMAACQSDESEGNVVGDVTLSIKTEENQWTYISFEKGVVKGTSVLGDAVADSLWKSRTDWDVAFCGDMMRTNGGASGDGAGGLQEVETDYDKVHEALSSGYDLDSIVDIW